MARFGLRIVCLLVLFATTGELLGAGPKNRSKEAYLAHKKAFTERFTKSAETKTVFVKEEKDSRKDAKIAKELPATRGILCSRSMSLRSWRLCESDSGF